MLMPAGEQAWIPREKLHRYLLDPSHPEGAGKATLFRRLLGITAANADALSDALLHAAATREVRSQTRTPHGTKYRIEFAMESKRGTYTVVSVWIAPAENQPPKLVTAYVK